MTPPKRSSSSSAAAAASSAKKFDVFELNEEDERVEKESSRILGKFANLKKNRSSSITKYKYLEVFAQQPKSLHEDISSDPIELDAEACEFTQESNSLLEDVGSKSSEVGNSGTDHKCTHATSCLIGVSLQETAVKGEISGSNDFLESSYEFRNESCDIVSSDDNFSQISSSSTSTSSSAEIEASLEDKLMKHGSIAFEINGMKMEVDVFPDFILYGDICSTNSRLTFLCSSMKLEGSTVNGTGGTFKFEWPIENIMKIESYWCGKVETTMIKLFLKPDDSRGDRNTNQNQGFKELKFTVNDPCWSKAEQAVKSLDVRYNNLWSTIFDFDTDDENFSEFGPNSHVSWMHYFPIFDETFDEIIYPKGDPDAVSISKRDIELLKPETFINDTIIDFYIKYLKNKIPTDEQNRFHFFNCFFFRKLADLDNDPSSACDGRAAFQRVRKWTRKVNLFEKDYIFVPINYSLHWSLIVICHPGEVAYFQDEEIEESSKVPCILHMDSFKGSHKGLKDVFQSYLSEEWKERHSGMVDDVSSKFLHLRFVSLELPQQENLYDCGLFLLHYVERFLNEAPINFSPFKITKFSDFLKGDWFPPIEASLKRAHIQKLIYDIFQDNFQEVLPTDCIAKSSPRCGSCHQTIWVENSFSSANQGTNIRFPVGSSTRVASCFREPGFFPKDMQGTVLYSSAANCQRVVARNQSGFLSPIPEIEEGDEETAGSSLMMEDSQVAVLASDFPSTSYFSKDFRASETSMQGLSQDFIDAVQGHSYSRISSGASWNTLETETQEDQPREKVERSNLSDKTDRLEYCSSTSCEELADCVVEDSQEAYGIHDDVVASVKSPSSVQGNVNPLTKNFDWSQTIYLEDDDSVCKREPPVSESDEQDAKRRRLLEPDGERPITGSLLKESCLMSM